MVTDDEAVYLAFLSLAATLEHRIKAIRDRKVACSLLVAFLDVHLIQMREAFRTLIEAIEDADAL